MCFKLEKVIKSGLKYNNLFFTCVELKSPLASNSANQYKLIK